MKATETFQRGLKNVLLDLCSCLIREVQKKSQARPKVVEV